MFDEGVCDFDGVFGAVVEDVQDTRGQTCLLEDVSDGPEAAWRELAALEDASVSGCNGVCNGANTEDVWPIPVYGLVSLA